MPNERRSNRKRSSENREQDRRVAGGRDQLASQPGYQKGAEEAAARARDITERVADRQGDGATYRWTPAITTTSSSGEAASRAGQGFADDTKADIDKMTRPVRAESASGADPEVTVEQGIERAGGRVGGYILDLQFVTFDGPDVFTIDVDVAGIRRPTTSSAAPRSSRTKCTTCCTCRSVLTTSKRTPRANRCRFRIVVICSNAR
jgi:hypothetical protein